MFWITVTLFVTLTALDTIASDTGPSNGCLNDVFKHLAGQFFHGGRIADTVIDSVDPLYVKESHFHGTTPMSELNICYSDIYLYGLNSLCVQEASIQVDGTKVVMTAKTFTPQFKMCAKYRAQGRVLLFDCNTSSGDSVTTFGAFRPADRVDAVHTMRSTLGCDGLLRVDDYEVCQSIGDINISYQNLLGGGVAGMVAEKMILANKYCVKKDLGQTLDKILATGLKEHAAKVLTTLSWAEITAILSKSS